MRRRCRSRSFRTARPRVTRISCSMARARRSSIRPTWSCGRSSPTKHRADSRRVNLDALTREDVAAWQPGERLLLSGKMLTGRDAAHKRLSQLIDAGQPLPEGLDFKNRVIYYVGPVDPVKGEAVGPAGPTTATRMDKFTEMMLAQDRPDRDGRQGRARPGSDRSDPQAQGCVPDGGRRRGVPGFQGDPLEPRGRVRRPRHGSDLRIRSEGHAGDGGRRRARRIGARDRPGRMAQRIKGIPVKTGQEPSGRSSISSDPAAAHGAGVSHRLRAGCAWARIACARCARDASIRSRLRRRSRCSETLQNVQSADHFRNLFEVPVLFYALCGFLAITQLTTLFLLACAWGYVVLRAAHAYIHLTQQQSHAALSGVRREHDRAVRDVGDLRGQAAVVVRVGLKPDLTGPSRRSGFSPTSSSVGSL